MNIYAKHRYFLHQWRRYLKQNLLSRCISTCSPEILQKNGRETAVNPNTELHDHTKYKHAKNGDFTQDSPVLRNPYDQDGLLRAYLQRHLPQQYFEEVDTDLHRFGKDITASIDNLGRQCELHPPFLTQFDAWGNRIDHVSTCKEWQEMKIIAAKEGVIAHGYERKFGSWSRLYQMAKLYLFAPSSGLYSCPLAMVDGAAKVLETYMNDSSSNPPPFVADAYRNLTSKNPERFWTAGQWMTEKGGGSDVADGTDTRAHIQPDGSYKLYGYKWFTSATDADMALTLARIVDDRGVVPPGSKGLSLFYLETRDPSNSDHASGFNGIQIQRMKDKLGTRQLPTGELLLDGTVAQLLGQPTSGVRLISGMLTLTRIHNALVSAASMRRLLLLSKDYATRRRVFGSQLKDHALHMQTLARMEVECRAGFMLAFETVKLLGSTETTPGEDSDAQRHLLRLLTPVAKLYTAKQAIATNSEGLESFGGAGYLEDTGLPVFLRDAQVLSIWEGTTNVLSLDVLRAIAKSRGETLNCFFEDVNKRLGEVSDRGRRDLRQATSRVHIAAGDLRGFINQTSTMGPDVMFLAARDFSYSIARIYAGMLLLEHAAWEGASAADAHAATVWCTQDLCPAMTMLKSGAYNAKSSDLNTELVFESFQN